MFSLKKGEGSLNIILMLESLISVICVFKSKTELMSFDVLFTGQTAEQYVIDGTPSITYCSAVCPVNNTTHDISSDIDLKLSITENSDSSNNILFSCLSSKQYNKRHQFYVVCCIVYWTSS
jgi:hypothetical protein